MENNLYLWWNKVDQKGLLFRGTYHKDKGGIHIKGQTNKGKEIRECLMEQHNVLYQCIPVTPENR